MDSKTTSSTHLYINNNLFNTAFSYNTGKRITAFLVWIILFSGSWFVRESHAQSYSRTYTVTNTDDSGTGSLRAAMDSAEADGGPSKIVFNIDGGNPHVLSLESSLPYMNHPVFIDGTSQPGFDGTPVIELDGTPTGGYGTAFTIKGGESKIKGLSIVNFATAISIQNANNNTIAGCYIGVETDGTTNGGNSSRGIVIKESSNNTIGGPDATDRNVISNSGDDGIYVTGYSFGSTVNPDRVADSTKIINNYIGVDVNGEVKMGNTGSGIHIVGPSRVNTIRHNVISNNGGDGINVTGPYTDDYTIVGNKIGTDATGMSPEMNFNIGVYLSKVSHVVIGGPEVKDRNIISGNYTDGIYLEYGTDFTIQGNYIGTDVTGKKRLGNAREFINSQNEGGDQESGIYLQYGASNVLIGGSEDGDGNVISGNYGMGIYTDNAVQPYNTATDIRDVKITGNMIGTTVNGLDSLGNRMGIAAQTTDSLLIKNNVISGNGYYRSSSDFFGRGIYLWNGSDHAVIQGNKVGTDVYGTRVLPNGNQGGIQIDSADSTFIGGSTRADGNIISGNDTWGLGLYDATHTQVKNNKIGVGQDGYTPLPNGTQGIFIFHGSHDNMIGGTAKDVGNVVAYNGKNGIVVDQVNSDYGTSNSIRHNEVYANGEIGIDLDGSDTSVPGDSLTVNDTGDSDSGPNNLQNYPEIDNVAYDSTSNELSITYKVDAAASNSTYPLHVEFYKADTTDQARTFLGSDDYSSGNANQFKTIQFTSQSGYSNTEYVVATATDDKGNTSEINPVIQKANFAANKKDSVKYGYVGVYVILNADSLSSGQNENIGIWHSNHAPADSIPARTKLAAKGSWYLNASDRLSFYGELCFDLGKKFSIVDNQSLYVYERPSPDSAWTLAPNQKFKTIAGTNYLCVDLRNRHQSKEYVLATSMNLHKLIVKGPKAGWHMVSSPVSKTTFNQLLGPFWTQGVPGSDAPGDSASVLSFRESMQKFVKPSDMTDQLNAGQGYLAYIYSDDNGDGINDGFPKTNILSGAANVSPVKISVSATDAGSDGVDSLEGWNLVGNPFDGALNVDQVLKAAEAVSPDVNRNIYIWDPNKSGGGGYRVLPEGEAKTIAPFQGFLIRYMSPVDGTISVDQSMVVGKGGIRYKQDLPPEIILKLQNGDLYDQFRVVVDTSASGGLDVHDAFKLVPLDTGYVKIYGIAGKRYPVAITRVPVTDQQINIPVGFATDTTGSFELSWPEMDNIPDNWGLGLKDLQTGHVINLRANKYFRFDVQKATSLFKTRGPSQGVVTISAIPKDTARFVLTIAPGGLTAIDGTKELPAKVDLRQNYPNPFNPDYS